MSKSEDELRLLRELERIANYIEEKEPVRRALTNDDLERGVRNGRIRMYPRDIPIELRDGVIFYSSGWGWRLRNGWERTWMSKVDVAMAKPVEIEETAGLSRRLGLKAIYAMKADAYNVPVADGRILTLDCFLMTGMYTGGNESDEMVQMERARLLHQADQVGESIMAELKAIGGTAIDIEMNKMMGSEEEEICMDGGREVDNRDRGEELYTVVAIDERGYVLDVGEIYSVADWPYVAAWRDGDRAGIALSTVPTFDPMYTKDFLAAPSVMFHVMVNNMARVMGQRDALAELVAAIRDGNPGVEEMPLWADALSSGALEGWV